MSSPIVYLGDIVRPANPSHPAWKRLVRLPIGLVPIDGTPMRIRRDRLLEAVRAAEATSAWIELVGADEIQVTYRPSTKATVAAAGNHRSIRQVSASRTRADAGVRSNAESGYRSHRPTAQALQNALVETDSVEPSTQRRLQYWIGRRIEQQHPHVSEYFHLEIPARQNGFAALAEASQITSTEFLEQVGPGVNRLRVVGVSAGQSCEGILDIVLEAHRLAVAARSTLRRGHRVTAEDLVEKPVPDSEWRDHYVTDPETLLGKEVIGSIRAGQLVGAGDLRKPVLIQRGDLVEVRVMGGGVRVTANARSLDEGGAMDLVQVETLDPRRKLVARVVEPGLVEVITRAPKLSP